MIPCSTAVWIFKQSPFSLFYKKLSTYPHESDVTNKRAKGKVAQFESKPSLTDRQIDVWLDGRAGWRTQGHKDGHTDGRREISPYLNPIENVWRDVKLGLKQLRPRNLQELEDNVFNIWNNFPIRKCHSYIRSMPRGVRAGMDARGGYTEYWMGQTLRSSSVCVTEPNC